MPATVSPQLLTDIPARDANTESSLHKVQKSRKLEKCENPAKPDTIGVSALAGRTFTKLQRPRPCPIPKARDGWRHPQVLGIPRPAHVFHRAPHGKDGLVAVRLLQLSKRQTGRCIAASY